MSPAAIARCAAASTGARRREIRLADLHVHDRAAGGLEGARGRLHLHHMERRDLRDAGRGGDAGSIEGRRAVRAAKALSYRLSTNAISLSSCARSFAVARLRPAGRRARPWTSVQMRRRAQSAGVPGRGLPGGPRVAQFRRRSGHGFGDPERPVPGTTTRARRAGAAAGQARERHRQEGRPSAGDPSERRFIHPGMHEGEVLARVGSARSEERRQRAQARALDVHAGRRDPQTVTTGDFEYGQVMEVERKVVR